MNNPRHTSWAYCVVVLAWLTVVVTGCSSNTSENPESYVTGKVTLDGEPLPEGRLIFTTVKLGLNDVVPIRDGQFSGRVALGDRQVMISVIELMDPPPSTMPGVEESGKVPTETLPARYNAETTLSATITADGPNEFVFNLVSGEESTPPSPESKKKKR